MNGVGNAGTPRGGTSCSAGCASSSARWWACSLTFGMADRSTVRMRSARPLTKAATPPRSLASQVEDVQEAILALGAGNL